MATFSERCLHGDTDAFTKELRRFLHEHHGGISSDLIEGLRQTVLDKEWIPPTSEDHGLAMDEQVVTELGSRSESVCYATDAKRDTLATKAESEADVDAAEKDKEGLVVVAGSTKTDAGHLARGSTVKDEAGCMIAERHQEAVLAQTGASAGSKAFVMAENEVQEEGGSRAAGKEQERAIATATSKIEAERLASEMISKEKVESMEQERLNAGVLAEADADAGRLDGEKVAKEESERGREGKEQRTMIAEVKVEAEGDNITNAVDVMKAEPDRPTLTSSAREGDQGTKQNKFVVAAPGLNESVADNIVKEENERLATEEANRIEQEKVAVQNTEDAIEYESKRFDPPRREIPKSEPDEIVANMAKLQEVEAEVDQSAAKEGADRLSPEEEKERLVVEAQETLESEGAESAAKEEGDMPAAENEQERVVAVAIAKAEAERFDLEIAAKERAGRIPQGRLSAEVIAEAEAERWAGMNIAKQEVKRVGEGEDEERLIAEVKVLGEVEAVADAVVVVQAETDRPALTLSAREDAQRMEHRSFAVEEAAEGTESAAENAGKGEAKRSATEKVAKIDDFGSIEQEELTIQAVEDATEEEEEEAETLPLARREAGDEVVVVESMAKMKEHTDVV